MNLRILKKLSKKAAPLLAHFDIGPDDLFLAEPHECHTGLILEGSRKDRWHRLATRFGDAPYAPLKGTPMVRRMSGGEETEWDARTALEELAECIRWSDKPATMTDAEWALAQRITRTTPVTQDEIDEMLDDMDDEAPCDFDLMDEELAL
nr:hypothetical protein [uncultured Azospirillum sp.]